MFHCQKCDAQQLKWAGRCNECGAWGTLTEEVGATSSSSSLSSKGGSASGGKRRGDDKHAKATVVSFDALGSQTIKHVPTGIPELDRVLGGGLVSGVAILLSGEPGIGKSTLIAQVAHTFSSTSDKPILISSGEESPEQIRLRLERLGVKLTQIKMIEETEVESLASAVDSLSPSLIIVDSIQTASTQEVEGIAGSQTQVKASAAKLVELAKHSSVPMIIVGQITKDGSIAGPKMLEHLVDVVLDLEGDPTSSYRLLSATKNRFGSTDEVGIFEMTEKGLETVSDPSKKFLAERNPGPGSVVTSVMEGKRPVLVEVQALVEKTSYGYPVRRASGFDVNRLQLLIAIANKHAKAGLGDFDVYVNVVGGLKIKEPSADLAVIAALLSAKQDFAIAETLIVGEVGLGGEVRKASFFDRRTAEGERFGYKKMKEIKHVSELSFYSK